MALPKLATILSVILLPVLSTNAGLAQDASTVNASTARPSFEITGITAYGDYYSNGIPLGGVSSNGPNNLPYNLDAGVSVQLDWRRFTGRTVFALSYTPSYTVDKRYSSLSGTNQLFTMNVSRNLTPRLTYQFSVTGAYQNIEQTFFGANSLSNIVSSPATFQQFSSALLTGNYAGNPQLGVALTNAQAAESPLNTLIYGVRMLTASLQTSLSYSLSPRLSVSVRGSDGRSQRISSSQSSAFLLPNTTSASAGIDFSYSLSPVSNFGASVVSSRVTSSNLDSYTTTSQATLGHSFGERWIAQVHAGVAITNLLRESTNVSIAAAPRPVVGGNLGYKTPAGSFLGSYERSTTDSYGLGASATTTATGAWQWKRRGSGWWLETTFSWNQLTGSAILNTSGWQASTSVNRKLGEHLTLLSQYSYLAYSGGLQTSAYHLAESAVRTSLVYSPHPVNTAQ